jgi:hypothetical protein
MACFRVDFVGRGELSERQQKLGQFLQRLNHIANGMLSYTMFPYKRIIDLMFQSSTLQSS